MRRQSGVLMHPTSFANPYGIGTLGQGALDFADFLHRAGQTLWQMLPIGPVGYGESPYSAYSSFAGNPLLIDLELLAAEGWLLPGDLTPAPDFSPYRVEFSRVRAWKEPKLALAADRFAAAVLGEPNRSGAAGTPAARGAKSAGAVGGKGTEGGVDLVAERRQYREFLEAESYWLTDFASFMALKAHFEAKAADSAPPQEKAPNTAWNECWDEAVRRYQPAAVAAWQQHLSAEIRQITVIQYFFFKQWNRLKSYANAKGIELIGDIPIFVAPDSADVWAHRDNFLVDENGRPEKTAGVPPDYFCPEGQRWGNPLYNWKYMEADGFRWWLQRIRSLFTRFDIARIDHFRGFEAYWEIPAANPTAVHGRWVKAKGAALFKTIRRELGALPIIAEDLGFITPAVHRLRRSLGFPGMKILQFAFERNGSGVFNAQNAYLPHNCEVNSVMYTGTHDNDTTLGWYASLPEDTKRLVRDYIGRDDAHIVWDCIRLALASPCERVLVPMQDWLGYGSDTRMNTPATVGGSNWAWRLEPGRLPPELAGRMAFLTQLYGR